MAEARTRWCRRARNGAPACPPRFGSPEELNGWLDRAIAGAPDVTGPAPEPDTSRFEPAVDAFDLPAAHVMVQSGPVLLVVRVPYDASQDNVAKVMRDAPDLAGNLAEHGHASVVLTPEYHGFEFEVVTA